MKKLITYLLVAITMIIAGCSESFDDSKIWDKLNDHESRIAKLEELCKQMNTNISSLQAIVKALQNNDYVTGVTPITKEGETVGYTITFTKSQPITIYHGKDGKDGQNGTDGKDGVDGKDGSTPIIGVKQDTDNIYYWTLNGEWLLDANGNKIKAQGTDGKDGQDGTNGEDGADGITPQLKIENDYWYISYDNGASWTQLGKATGEQGEKGESGQDGGLFKSVNETETEIIFTLTDDTIISIPKAVSLDIAFSNTDSINALPNQTYEIEYTIQGADDATTIDVVAQDYYKATVVPADYKSGKIVVTTPSADFAASRILVFVSKGNNTIMRVINFVESVIIVSTSTLDIEAEGGVVQIEVETNVVYTVEIPETDKEWIAIADTRAATHTETLTFTVQANPNTTYRYSTVNLKDESGLVAQSILFAQQASGYKTVNVATAGTLESYISANEKENLIGLKLSGNLNTFDYDFMRTMPALKQVDLAQINNTTIPSSCFKNATIKTVILPLNLTAIPDNAFYGSNITAIDIPSSVKSIGASAFYKCASLSGNLILPDGLQSIGEKAFYHCRALTGNLIIPNSVTSIGEYAFYYCDGFDGTLTLSTSLTEISNYSFAYCSNFIGDLIIPDNVITIGECAFWCDSGFNGNLIIGSAVSVIYEDAFNTSGSSSSYMIFRAAKFYCKATTAPIAHDGAFGFNRGYKVDEWLGVPVGSKSSYESASIWRWFATIEEVEF